MKLSDQITRKQLFVAFGTSQQTGGLTSVDLEATRDGNQVILSASDGSIAPLPGADATTAGVMTAADKAALDGIPPTTTREFAARTDIAGAAVSAGITHLRTAGYSSAGDAGGGIYKRAGAEPAHALKVQSADGAWWELAPGPEGISVRQAGATGDGITDDGQAFRDALAGVAGFNASGVDVAVHRVAVPPGDYYLGSTTLEIKKAVHLAGTGSGLAGIKPARLRWDANVTGIIVHRSDTLGAGREGAGTGAGVGSAIEGLWLESTGGTIAAVTDGTKGHGVWLRARAVLRDLSIERFPGNGIHIVASAVGADGVQGNANSWMVDTARIIQCQQNGIYVDGSDVNAGHARLIDVSSNGRWGIWDSSFLGNTYIACHAATNGLAETAGNGTGESSYVEFGGRRYSANVNATEAQLVATQPGADEGVWLDVTAGASSSTVPAWQAAQSEGTYFHGGSYRTDNANADNVFIGNYAEINHGVAQFVNPTFWIGGDGFTPKGAFGGFGGGSLGPVLFGNVRLFNQDLYSPDRDLELALNARPNTFMRLVAAGDHSQGLALTWQESEGAWAWMHSASNGERSLWFSTDLTTLNFGRSSPVGSGEVIAARGLWVGRDGNNPDNSRFQGNGLAAPTGGAWARGDIIWHRAPSAGGNAGWICVMPGTPGTWKAFGTIEA